MVEPSRDRASCSVTSNRRRLHLKSLTPMAEASGRSHRTGEVPMSSRGYLPPRAPRSRRPDTSRTHNGLLRVLLPENVQVDRHSGNGTGSGGTWPPILEKTLHRPASICPTAVKRPPLALACQLSIARHSRTCHRWPGWLPLRRSPGWHSGA